MYNRRKIEQSIQAVSALSVEINCKTIEYREEKGKINKFLLYDKLVDLRQKLGATKEDVAFQVTLLKAALYDATVDVSEAEGMAYADAVSLFDELKRDMKRYGNIEFAD